MFYDFLSQQALKYCIIFYNYTQHNKFVLLYLLYKRNEKKLNHMLWICDEI